MQRTLNRNLNELTVAIHSSDNSFGFGYRKNNNLESEKLFIKKFDNDLCNNLINDLNKFITKENLQKTCLINDLYHLSMRNQKYHLYYE